MLADHIGVSQLRDLAGRSERYTDTVSLAGMARLADLLHPEYEPAEPVLKVSIDFLGGMQGFPEISGHVSGSLGIACQRCLGSMDWAVDTDFRLVVVSSENDLDEVAEPFDTIVAGEHGIDLRQLIEDELLGSLPLAPMHADSEKCEAATGVHVYDEQEPMADNETNKPFAGLEAMLKDASPANNDGSN